MYKFRLFFYKSIVLDFFVNFNYMYYINNIFMIRFEEIFLLDIYLYVICGFIYINIVVRE